MKSLAENEIVFVCFFGCYIYIFFLINVFIALLLPLLSTFKSMLNNFNDLYFENKMNTDKKELISYVNYIEIWKIITEARLSY